MHRDKKHKPSPSLGPVDTSEWSSFPVFTAVRLVGRECLHTSGDYGFLRVIDEFLDNLSGSLTMPAAYENSGGSLRLLQYLAVRESSTMDPFLRCWEVNAVTGQMAARGDIQSLKWVAEKYLPGEFLTEVVVQASTNGHVQVLKWLWENHRDICYWGGIELCGALRNKRHELVEWVKTHVVLRPECAQQVIKQAAASGNLGMVKWLYGTFDVGIVESLNAAALNCQWEVMRWLVDNGTRAELDAALNSGRICSSPAQHGRLEILKFLFERGLVRDPVNVLQTAATYGHLHIVQWLHEDKGITNAGGAFFLAAKNGQLDVLKYLYQKKLHSNSPYPAFDAAAGSGFLEIVKWFHFNTQDQCTSRAMDEAAGRGHLEMVQWLHENRTEGCSYLAIHYAAQKGHLEIVKWLHANRNADCHITTMKMAAECGELDIVKWLHANRHEEFVLDGAMDTAAADGHLDILQWFHENCDGGCTTAAMDWAAGNGHLNVVKWLHTHRTEGCTQRAMDDAAQNGHLEVVEWLHLNRSEGCSTMAIDGAAGNSHLEIVKWLHCHRSQRCTPLALEVLFSKSRRLDTAVFLSSEFPECRSFHLGSEFEIAWLEVVQWLLECAPGALEGCTVRVKSWNWHVCDWLAQNNWTLLDKDLVFSFWNQSV